MDDYLTVGSVHPKLEILQQNGIGVKKPDYVAPKFTNNQLYLSGYGRHWGEKMTYSVGLAYGTGVLVGGSFGVIKSVAKGAATRKLFINSMLNMCGVYGPGLGNKAACVTLLYYVINNIVKLADTSGNDVYHAPAAGLAAGALYKCKGSWPSMGKHSVGSAVAFTGIDYALRNSLI
ncbi:hypothetical protein BgAZ_202020 [Babesia gibsoni]|uniref:Uncharacterized protein n=1 Tax=Babesia gibsoni TaxID=33632 RepID=A0AAD8PE66_BABGI|nr:hypothetical protein BgAZ_202020 [Babesia gibsoni]